MRFKEVKEMAKKLGLVESYYGVCGGGTPKLNSREFCCWNQTGEKDAEDLVYAEYIGEQVVTLDIAGLSIIEIDK